MSMESKKSNINKIANQLLLTNLLKFASLSQSGCTQTLSHHRNSLVGYIYRYNKKIFPRSFSYFFLLSIYRALAKKYDPRKDVKRIDLFKQMIKSHGGVITKLLIPALEHHILALSSLNPGIKIGLGENITINKNDIFDQDETAILDKYIEKIEPEKYEDYIIFLQSNENIEEFDTDHFKNFEKEIKAIKDFYIICENLRKVYYPNFYSPSEYKKINFINNKEGGFLMKKSAIKKRFKVNDFSKLFFFTANDDYMHPTISKGDDCLVVKTSLANTNAFRSGLFVVNELGRICIRRLQFTMFENTYQIISIPDNKKYSRQTISALDNKGNPRKDYILGKVIWKSGFTLEQENIDNKNQSLFDDNTDFMIPEFLTRQQAVSNSEPDLTKLFEQPEEFIIKDKKKRA